MDSDMTAMAYAPISWELLCVRSEAHRICDERGIRDLEAMERIEAAIRHQRFMRAIEPVLRQKTRIYNLRMLSKIIFDPSTGASTTEYIPLSAEAEKALSTLDDMIAAEATRWGFTLPESTPPAPDA